MDTLSVVVTEIREECLVSPLLYNRPSMVLVFVRKEYANSYRTTFRNLINQRLMSISKDWLPKSKAGSEMLRKSSKHWRDSSNRSPPILNQVKQITTDCSKKWHSISKSAIMQMQYSYTKKLYLRIQTYQSIVCSVKNTSQWISSLMS